MNHRTPILQIWEWLRPKLNLQQVPFIGPVVETFIYEYMLRAIEINLNDVIHDNRTTVALVVFAVLYNVAIGDDPIPGFRDQYETPMRLTEVLGVPTQRYKLRKYYPLAVVRIHQNFPPVEE
jgi:hypothetical protein